MARPNIRTSWLRRLEWRAFALLGVLSLGLWVLFTFVSESLAF